MKYIKNQKGITMVILLVTIIIIGILATITITALSNTDNIGPYNKMIADIDLLEDKILIYYNQNGEIPVIPNTEETINNMTYKKIDINKLENITLYYGSSNEQNDYYLVNDSLEVYYKKGTQKSGHVYNTND